MRLCSDISQLKVMQNANLLHFLCNVYTSILSLLGFIRGSIDGVKAVRPWEKPKLYFVSKSKYLIKQYKMPMFQSFCKFNTNMRICKNMGCGERFRYDNDRTIHKKQRQMLQRSKNLKNHCFKIVLELLLY